ncbi:hypothetical protein QYF61_016382 [Mycteria americana]|uniref:Uncharacterized protein n=1 Tax=Mycteria americana TaxID=33587 RepID=A0AAN7RW87_MYCAM|nr:hypothetical protein QYF61_016382 [Mycteria americana]
MSSQVQDLAFVFAKLHTVLACPLFQPVQFSVISKLGEGAFNPIVQIIYEDVEEHGAHLFVNFLPISQTTHLVCNLPVYPGEGCGKQEGDQEDESQKVKELVADYKERIKCLQQAAKSAEAKNAQQAQKLVQVTVVMAAQKAEHIHGKKNKGKQDLEDLMAVQSEDWDPETWDGVIWESRGGPRHSRKPETWMPASTLRNSVWVEASDVLETIGSCVLIEALNHQMKELQEVVRRLHTIRENEQDIDRVFAETLQSQEPKPHVARKEGQIETALKEMLQNRYNALATGEEEPHSGKVSEPTKPQPSVYTKKKRRLILHVVEAPICQPDLMSQEPVPMLDNPLSEVTFPNIQSKPPLAQLEAISSHPITCDLGEETDPHLSTTSFQIVVESDKVSPQPPFLQAEQPQFPQPLLIRLVLQTLHQLRCPSLDMLQHLNVSLVVGGPKLNTVFEVRPHQCRVQGHNHFPSPAGHAIFDTSQDAIDFLGRLGTLLAHIQAAVNQHPQVLLCQAAFQPLFPKPVALHGVVVTQVQDLALSLVEPHTIGPSPSIQPVQIPLQSLPTLKQINTPTQLGVICKLTEGALDPFVQIIDKDVKQNWPQHRALGNTTCDRPPTGVNPIHHHPLGPAVQPVLYPAKSTPVQAMSSQFLQENAVGNGVKGFTEVYVDNIHSLSLIH